MLIPFPAELNTGNGAVACSITTTDVHHDNVCRKSDVNLLRLKVRVDGETWPTSSAARRVDQRFSAEIEPGFNYQLLIVEEL